MTLAHLLTGALAALILAACATVTPQQLPARNALGDFALNGRFALRANRPGEEPQSSGGRIDWTHHQDSDRILLANPLGYGLAEINAGPSGATLRTADGKTRSSATPDELLEAVTGQRLPLTCLSAWLLGRPCADARITHDVLARPVNLHEQAWQIDYFYDELTAEALPSRITLSHEPDIELKLRIEEWKTTPTKDAP